MMDLYKRQKARERFKHRRQDDESIRSKFRSNRSSGRKIETKVLLYELISLSWFFFQNILNLIVIRRFKSIL